jgi:predicted restriction endonuclease
MSIELKLRVLNRYDYTCAVCGRAAVLVADVAHPFEDATIAPADEARLIVLCSNHNQAQQRAHLEHKPPLSESFSPEELSLVAQSSRKGGYKRAYAAARLNSSS